MPFSYGWLTADRLHYNHPVRPRNLHPLPLGQFTDRPPQRRGIRRRKSQVNIRLVAWAVGILIVVAAGAYVFWGLPPVSALGKGLDTPSIRITDRNGRLLYDILPQQGGRHAVLSFANIPQCMKDATVAVEDKTF